MNYTISQMAKQLGIPASTIRYYDKEGLLPFIERTPGGNRIFQDKDIEWLQLIQCMKKANMPLKDIRSYIQLAKEGNDTLQARKEIFEHQREVLAGQMKDLEHTMEVVNYKCWYYDKIEEYGSEQAVHDLKDDQIPENYRAIRKWLRNGFHSDEFKNNK